MNRPVTGEPPPVIDYAPGDGGRPRPYLLWLIPFWAVAVLAAVAYVAYRPIPPPAPPVVAPVAPPAPVIP